MSFADILLDFLPLIVVAFATIIGPIVAYLLINRYEHEKDRKKIKEQILVSLLDFRQTFDAELRTYRYIKNKKERVAKLRELWPLLGRAAARILGLIRIHFEKSGDIVSFIKLYNETIDEMTLIRDLNDKISEGELVENVLSKKEEFYFKEEIISKAKDKLHYFVEQTEMLLRIVILY